MISLPASLPLTSDARIPQTYAAAKTALERCSRVDECKDWADKAEALSSYARQADDGALRQLADRIQARAIRRCGELIQEFQPKGGFRVDLEPRDGGDPRTRREFATDGKLSGRQYKTAMRVANVPEAEFEAAVESDNPPTVTQLAERGKKPQPVQIIDLKGRDPKEFTLSTQAQGELRRFAEMTERIAPDIAVRGAFGDERRQMLANAATISTWIQQMKEEVRNVSPND